MEQGTQVSVEGFRLSEKSKKSDTEKLPVYQTKSKSRDAEHVSSNDTFQAAIVNTLLKKEGEQFRGPFPRIVLKDS